MVLSNMDAVIQESERVAEVARNAPALLENLEAEFAQKTGLSGLDITFLFFAVALQCVRQYLFTSFEERVNDKQSAKQAHKQEEKIFDALFDEDDLTGTGKPYYYASLADITTKGVPYDAQDGSKKFDLGGRPNVGLSGSTHRFRTLGHDPVLGWIFGTANIVTRTLTDWKFASYHVRDLPIASGARRPGLYQHASTEKVFARTYDRLKMEPEAVAAALIKQALHYKSDMYSTAGLPLPAVSSLGSPDFAQKLASYGVDLGNVLTVANQVAGAVLINTIISMVHRLFYDEKKHGSEKLYEVKTRKILSCSNAIATASNVIYVAVSTYFGDSSAVRKLDVGGAIVTIYRLISDYNFIQNVKQEFVFGNFDKLIQGTDHYFDEV